MIQGIRMKAPAHRGGFVNSEIIEALPVRHRRGRVTRAALSALVNERAQLSPEMALRTEKAFGVSMDTLMRMQNSFDISKARRREGEIDGAPFIGEPPDAPPPARAWQQATGIGSSDQDA